jgi:hypothetical protein
MRKTLPTLDEKLYQMRMECLPADQASSSAMTLSAAEPAPARSACCHDLQFVGDRVERARVDFPRPN